MVLCTVIQDESGLINQKRSRGCKNLLNLLPTIKVKRFAATGGCSCGHVKELYIAGDTSRNPKEKTCMFGAAERDIAKIGKKVGKNKNQSKEPSKQ